MNILRMTSTDPCLNLAMEEHLLRTRTEGVLLLLWQNWPTIVVGRHQNTLAEIDLGYVERNNITVVRRNSGGGAVYHDLGNVNFSFITDARTAEELRMENFLRPVVDVLRLVGVEAEVSGRNDITVQGRKISGNAQSLVGHRLLHHGTLLYNCELEVLAEALRARPEKFASRAVKSVRGRVANIVDFLSDPLEVEDFIEFLSAGLTGSNAAESLQLTAADHQAAEALAEARYRTWEWNFGLSPQFTWNHCRKYSGGLLEVSLEVHKGCIESVLFQGDFMSLRSVEPVSRRLGGLAFTPSAVGAVLESLPLEEYFGAITKDEILDCLFDSAKPLPS